MDKTIKAVAGLFGAIAGYLWGPLNGILLALITMMCLDYISGVIVGAAQHQLNSHTSFVGLCKKALILIIVAVANIIDSQVFGGNTTVVRSATCCLFIANEGMSILENAGELGIPIPKKLRNVLEQLHKKDEEEPDNGKEDL